MKSSLDARVIKATIIINKEILPTERELKDFFNDYCRRYVYIIHDKDVKENGEIKNKHLHIVCELKERKRLSSLLNIICDYFKYKNPNGIEVDKVISWECCIQYLIHKNDLDKYQYDRKEVISNIDYNELCIIFDSTNQNISMDYLIYLCSTRNNMLDIMRALGLGYYTKYRNVIRDILDVLYREREN